MVVLPFNENSIQEYARVASDLKKRGQMIGAIDELIGGVCLAHAETLFTRNVVHFSKIDGLVVVDWFARHASNRNP